MLKSDRVPQIWIRALLGAGLLSLVFLAAWLIVLIDQPLLLIAGSAAPLVLGVGTLVAYAYPRAALLGILCWVQFGALFTKVTGVRAVLYASYVLPLALMVVVFVRMAVTRAPFTVPRSAIIPAFLIFLGILLIQTFNPIVPTLTMAANDLLSKYLVHMAGFVLGLILIRTRRDLSRLYLVIALSGSIAALYGIYQYVVGYPAFEDRWATSGYNEFHGVNVYQWIDRRVLATLLYSATYGLFSALCVLQTVPLWAQTSRRWQRAFLAGMIGLMTAGVFLSLTRGIWVAMGAGLGFWAVLHWNTVIFRVNLRRILSALIAAGTVVAAAIFIEPVRYRLGTFWYAFSEQYDARFAHWLDFWLPKMGDWHFFTGYGLGLAGAGAERFRPLREMFWGNGYSGITDNLYITIFVTTGIFGLLAFLAIAALALLRSYRLGRVLADPFLRLSATMLFVTFTMYLVSFMSADHLTDSYPANLMFWLLLAVVVRLPTLRDDPARKTV